MVEVCGALGLSATPEREYDEEGSQFILQEVGPVIFQFSLEDAIRRGILCEFDYVELPYQLTEGDRQRLQNVWSMKAARAAEGKPMSDTEVAIEIAKVYKTAEMKPSVFKEYAASSGGCCLNSCIAFVETRAYGEEVIPIIDRYTHKYRTYYAEDDRKYLVEFANQEIECLLTCHRISQGIDIQSLKNVVLFSSSRGRLETIQRIGRCLRVDPNNPNKRATVIDFVRPQEDGEPTSADTERAAWLRELSEIKREEFDGD